MTDDLPRKLGRYEVERELGRGAMGIVYLAQDAALGRTVAVKVVTLTGSEHERDMHEARFRQEARAAGGVSHPSIITIYDVGREGDTAFIAMEYVEGTELRELIQRGELTAPQAIEIAALVADGLAYAHERGVIHRDIKPGNIMVLADGRVKIMDFGIARLQEPSVKTQTGVLLGSPQYMSPEQISGQALDGRADVFSLGVVLYEMITGVKPFDAADLTQVLFWVVNMPAKPPSERRPGLPPVVDYIIARALKKKPDDRYASAAELAADLRECLPEVREAEKAMRERRALEASSALPAIPVAAPNGAEETTVPLSHERLELRPSRRFDSAEGLARLAEGTLRTAAAGAARPRRRMDRAVAVLLAAYGVATLLAVAIVLL